MQKHAHHAPIAAPAWPTDERGDLIIDEATYLLAGLVNHLPAQANLLIGLAEHIQAGQEWPGCCRRLLGELNVGARPGEEAAS